MTDSGLYPRMSDDPVDQLVFEREELVRDWWREEDQLRAQEGRDYRPLARGITA